MLTDVTLRDGLQMESRVVPVAKKIELFNLLKKCGYDRLEITSFVHPKWVPQLADSVEFCTTLFKANPSEDASRLMAFVPNMKGLELLLKFPIGWANAFIAVSESFNKKNVNKSVAETLEGLGALIERAHTEGRKVRVYISTVFGCPYEGAIRPEAVSSLTQKVQDLGADEIALSDTIGVARPLQVKDILSRLRVPVEQLALHFHNTYGMALACVQAASDVGIQQFDGATGGIGGCPYAKGASGNVPTEEIAYLLRQPDSKIEQKAIAETGAFLKSTLGARLGSHLLDISDKGGEWYGL